MLPENNKEKEEVPQHDSERAERRKNITRKAQKIVLRSLWREIRVRAAESFNDETPDGFIERAQHFYESISPGVSELCKEIASLIEPFIGFFG